MAPAGHCERGGMRWGFGPVAPAGGRPGDVTECDLAVEGQAHQRLVDRGLADVAARVGEAEDPGDLVTGQAGVQPEVAEYPAVEVRGSGHGLRVVTNDRPLDHDTVRLITRGRR